MKNSQNTMKKFFLFLLFCGFTQNGFSQPDDVLGDEANVSERRIPNVKVDRCIYLWDVTKSMQGHDKYKPNNYNPERDIWDPVVKWLKNDIEHISDENTELYILPFQENILVDDLKAWSGKATKADKAKLMKMIDGTKTAFSTVTGTNIVDPFREVMNKYIDKSRNNMVILLTDGKHNGTGGQEAWRNLLSTWHPYAKEHNAFLTYVMLTAEAMDDQISSVLNPATGQIISSDAARADQINIKPVQHVRLNVTDSVDVVKIRIPLENTKKGLPIPDGVRVAIKSADDSIIVVDEEVEVADELLTVQLAYSAKELKNIMDVETIANVPLTLELLNYDEILQKYNIRVVLMFSSVDLMLINKIQKKLTITLKK